MRLWQVYTAFQAVSLVRPAWRTDQLGTVPTRSLDEHTELYFKVNVSRVSFPHTG